jgi:SAM-dependent methyltransferase
VTGTDIEVVEPPGSGPSKYWRLLRENGAERALKVLCWDALYGRAYYDELSKVASFPIHFDGLDLRQMDAEQLGFSDGTFDLIVSHEVFEHLPNVPVVMSEIKRVAKPNAIAYIYVHNFTSLSGGHHIRWKYPDSEPPDDVPPWDHLRENRFPDIPSYLNRLRLGDYRRMFEEHFELLEWRHTKQEGKSLLTPALRAELASYTEEELLTKGVIAIVRNTK